MLGGGLAWDWPTTVVEQDDVEQTETIGRPLLVLANTCFLEQGKGIIK